MGLASTPRRRYCVKRRQEAANRATPVSCSGVSIPPACAKAICCVRFSMSEKGGVPHCSSIRRASVVSAMRCRHCTSSAEGVKASSAACASAETAQVDRVVKIRSNSKTFHASFMAVHAPCIDMLTEMKRSAAAPSGRTKKVTKRRPASRLEEQRKHTCEKALSQLPARMLRFA